jgi:ankyrin repeat protein
MTELPRELVGEFIDAAVDDHAKAEAMLKEHPRLIEARWHLDETVLHFLAVEYFTAGVRFLIERGADVNAVNTFGDTALQDVCGLGYEPLAELLLQHGADLHARLPERDSALQRAVRSGTVSLVRMLIDAGGDARFRTDDGETIFDTVDEARDNHEELIALLAEYGIARDGD